MANSKSAVPVMDDPQAARRNGRSASVDATAPNDKGVEENETGAEVQGAEARVDTGKRRMPDNLRRFLLRLQGGKMYLPAAYRIVWFRDECPDWLRRAI